MENNNDDFDNRVLKAYEKMEESREDAILDAMGVTDEDEVESENLREITFKKGQKIKIKKQYLDDPEENKLNYIIIEDKGDRVLIEPTNTSLNIIPQQTIKKYMIESFNINKIKQDIEILYKSLTKGVIKPGRVVNKQLDDIQKQLDNTEQSLGSKHGELWQQLQDFRESFSKLDTLRERVFKEAKEIDWLKRYIKNMPSANEYKDQVKHLVDDHIALSKILSQLGFQGDLNKKLIDFYNKFKESFSKLDTLRERVCKEADPLKNLKVGDSIHHPKYGKGVLTFVPGPKAYSKDTAKADFGNNKGQPIKLKDLVESVCKESYKFMFRSEEVTSKQWQNKNKIIDRYLQLNPRPMFSGKNKISKADFEMALQYLRVKGDALGENYITSSNWKLTQDKPDGTMAWENNKNHLIGVVEPKGDKWRAGFGKEPNKFFDNKRDAIKHVMGRMKAFPESSRLDTLRERVVLNENIRTSIEKDLKKLGKLKTKPTTIQDIADKYGVKYKIVLDIADKIYPKESFK